MPGDIDAGAERALLRRYRDDIVAEVLVVPHHGSRSSSSSAFLAAVRPRLALISRGYLNRFGHPHPEVSERFRRFGLAVCDTARQGALRLTADARGMREVAGWRRQHQYYWQEVASPPCAPAYNGAQENRR